MRSVFILLLLISSFASMAQPEGNSLQLKADGNFVSIPDAASASLSPNMTIEAWIYFRCNNAAGTHILTKGWCGSTWSYYFSVNNFRLRLGKWHPTLGGCAGNQALFESTDSLMLNTWNHIAVVVNGLSVSFFINGQNAGSTLLSGVNQVGFHTSNQPLRIGNYVNLGGSNTGTPKSNIDEMRIWHTARTQAEIQANMNDTVAGNSPGLYANWRMEQSGAGPGISVLNSATASGAATNGTTNGSVANILFNNNTSILNALPNCDPILWLRADAGVVTNGLNEVTQWTDQSGNNNHATSDATTLPTLLNNAINNKPVVDFTDDRLATPLINLTATDKVETFAVYKGVGAQPFTIYEFSDDYNVVTTGFTVADQDNSCPGCNYDVSANIKGDAGYNQNTLNQTQGCPKVINTSFDKSLSSQEARIWLNNVLQPKTPGTTDANNGNNYGNHRFYLGKRSANCAFCPGVMGEFHYAELIVYPRTLSLKEKNAIYAYLNQKYFSGTAASYTSLPSATVFNTNIYDDYSWKHTYNISDPSQVIASVKDHCLTLGARQDTVYVEPTAGQYNGQYFMRRHYTIQTAANPAGNKTVRLYYTNADFADLQTYVPSLSSHSQLVVTKYDGPSEDGVYDPVGGTITFIPAAQITTGTAFGQRYLEFEVNSFSEFWIHSGNSPLPLELLSFNAYAVSDHANLHWSVANMLQVQGFAIEKSNDAQNFSEIGFVRAGQEEQYSFTDPALLQTQQYYRLKILDNDGNFTYSPVVHLKDKQVEQARIFPNPVRNELKLYLPYDASSYSILDLSGRIIQSGALQQGIHTIATQHLSPSVYIIRIQGSQVESLRFTKE